MLSALPSSKTDFIIPIPIDTVRIPFIIRETEQASIETGENFKRETITDIGRPEDKTNFVDIERNQATIDLLVESFFSSGSGLERGIALKRFGDIADSRYLTEVLDRNSNQYCIHLVSVARNNHSAQQIQDNSALLTPKHSSTTPITNSIFYHNAYLSITSSLQTYSTTQIYTAYSNPKNYTLVKDVYAPQKEIREYLVIKKEHEIISGKSKPSDVYVPQPKVKNYLMIGNEHEITFKNITQPKETIIYRSSTENRSNQIYSGNKTKSVEIIANDTINYTKSVICLLRADNYCLKIFVREYSFNPSIASTNLYPARTESSNKETTTTSQKPDKLVTMVLNENLKSHEPLFSVDFSINSGEELSSKELNTTRDLTTITVDLYESSSNARKTETYDNNSIELFLSINKDKVTIKLKENYKQRIVEETTRQFPKEKQLEMVVEGSIEIESPKVYRKTTSKEETSEKPEYEKIAEGAFAIYTKRLEKDDIKNLDGSITKIKVLDAKTKIEREEQITNNSVFALLYNVLAKDELKIKEYSYVDTETKKQTKGWMLELNEEEGWGYIVKINGREPTYKQGTLNPLLDIKARKDDQIEFLKIKQGVYLDKEAKTLCAKVPVKKKDVSVDYTGKEIVEIFKGYSHDFSHAELRARLGAEYATRYFVDGKEVSPDTKITDYMFGDNLEVAIMSGKGIEDENRYIPKGAEEVFYKRVSLSDLAYLDGSLTEIEVRNKKSENLAWMESVKNNSVFAFIYQALGKKGVVVKNDAYIDTKTGEKKEGWIYESSGDNGNKGYIVKINGKEPAYKPGTKNPLLDIKVKEGDNIQVLKVKQGLYFDQESETKCGKIPVEKRKITDMDIGKELWKLSLEKELLHYSFDIRKKLGDDYTTRYFLNKKDAALGTVIDSSMINMEFESAIMSEPATITLPEKRRIALSQIINY